MKLVTTEFKFGGLREKHVVATWNLGNHLKQISQVKQEMSSMYVPSGPKTNIYTIYKIFVIFLPLFNILLQILLNVFITCMPL